MADTPDFEKMALDAHNAASKAGMLRQGSPFREIVPFLMEAYKAGIERAVEMIDEQETEQLRAKWAAEERYDRKGGEEANERYHLLCEIESAIRAEAASVGGDNAKA